MSRWLHRASMLLCQLEVELPPPRVAVVAVVVVEEAPQIEPMLLAPWACQRERRELGIAPMPTVPY